VSVGGDDYFPLCDKSIEYVFDREELAEMKKAHAAIAEKMHQIEELEQEQTREQRNVEVAALEDPFDLFSGI
jgi:hypothetical protein